MVPYGWLGVGAVSPCRADVNVSTKDQCRTGPPQGKAAASAARRRARSRPEPS